MKTFKTLNLITFLTLLIGFYLLTGCGFKTSSSSGDPNGGLRAEGWTSSATPLDTGAVFDVTPQIAVQPNGGGAAIAVWIKREDLDPADNFPAVYHLYAKRSVGGAWDTTDSGCPFGNPDATGNDGICVIDTGSAQYDAWSPKIAMDNNGDAIVVWQQHDGTAMRVYARRFSGGSWGGLQQLNNSAEFANFDAADPAIALEPDPTNNGAPDDAVGSAIAAWSQYNQKDWTISLDTSAPYDSVRSMAVYNGQLYAGMGSAAAGDGDVYLYDSGSLTWTLFLDNAAGTGFLEVDSMAVYGGNLYVGYGGAAGAGNVASYNSGTNTWTTVFQTNTPALNIGQYASVKSMAVYNGQLYIGTGTSTGNADVYRCTLCDGTDWTRVLHTVTAAYEEVPAMAVFQCSTCGAPQLYIGLGNTANTDADVYRCTLCAGDASDWTKVLDNGAPYNSVRSLAVYNGYLYVGHGDANNNADVKRCTKCDNTDWTTVFTGGAGYQAVRSMIAYNGFLYIGLGTTATAGTGDIERCTLCDNTDWTFSRNDGAGNFASTYEAVFSLAVYNGSLYAGFGSSANTDGDIWRFSAGWQTVARRLVNGVWDTADTVCPAGSGLNDGICYISGVAGSSVQPSQSPRVAMDNFGRAIAAFIKMTALNNCLASPTVDPATINYNLTLPTINCIDSQLHANLFNGTSWQSAIDLDPGLSSVASATPPLVLCFENATGTDAPFPGGRGDSGSTDACVNVIEYDLAMNESGQAALLIKTAWEESEDFDTGCVGFGSDLLGGPSCLPDGNAFEDYTGEAIVARQFDIAALGGSCPSWSQANADACWPLTRLANFGYANGTSFGTGPFAAGCPSSTFIDGLRVVLNCHFTNPRIALSPGGTTAIAVYERYDGTFYDIQAHRYDGTTWGGFTTIDAGAGEAHAPQIAMDSSGFGVAVWTQSDGTIFRVNSNCFAPSTGVNTTCGNVVATGWQGAANVDTGVGSENGYFNPVVALSDSGGTNSASSLFLGWSVVDNTTRLYYATGP